jgi:MoaA/NifB/PqqE/SkfB family radical SAM enzyme
MMTPDLYGKVNDVERYGAKLDLVTNGTLLRGERLLRTLARTLALLWVSIDGATAGTFESLRHGARFDDVLGNLRAYLKIRDEAPPVERHPIHYTYILMRRTIRELPDFIDLAKDLGGCLVNAVHLVLFTPEMEGEGLADDPELFNEWREKALERAARVGIWLQIPPPLPVPGREPEPGAAGAGQLPERCYFLWQRVYVTPLADIVPCCLAGMPSIGNLRDGPFHEIWNNGTYGEMRRRVHGPDPMGPCSTCYLIHRSPQQGEFRRTAPAPVLE